MRCVACDAEVPTGAKFCPNCGAAMRTQPGGIDTGGGAYVGGGVQTGGDFIGRDQTIHGGYTRTTQHGLSGTEVAQLFESVYRRIEEPAAPRKADAQEVRETVQRVEREVAKGEQADTERVERWLRGLADIAPDVLEVAVNALVNPAAAVASAVRALARRFQVRSA